MAVGIIVTLGFLAIIGYNYWGWFRTPELVGEQRPDYKDITIPNGSTFNSAKVDWNGVEFIVPKENQYDFGIRNVKFGDFDILSVSDRSKEANIPPFNSLQKTKWGSCNIRDYCKNQIDKRCYQ